MFHNGSSNIIADFLLRESLYSGTHSPRVSVPFSLSLSLSVALSRHLGITDPSIHQSEEELRKSHISHHSPLTFFVCIQTYFSLQLDVRGPEKNREYIHVLYPIMSRDL